MGKRGMKRPAAAFKKPAAALGSSAPSEALPTVSLGTWSVPPAPSSSQEEAVPAVPQSPSLPGSSQDSPSPEPASEPAPAPRRFWSWLFDNGSELEILDNVVCLMGHPSHNYPNQFLCLDRKRLLHLSIQENLIPQIPQWKWSDPQHKVLSCHVEPGDGTVDAEIMWVHPTSWDISDREFLDASRSWALSRHSEHLLQEELDYEQALEDQDRENRNEGLGRFESNQPNRQDRNEVPEGLESNPPFVLDRF